MLARHVKWQPGMRFVVMRFIYRLAAVAVVAAALVASGCAKNGDQEDIGDLPAKKLTVQHDSVASSGLVVTLDYDDTRCAVLDSDAFARLNGQPVSLFRGEYQYFPPMGDDGGFTCTHPSVTLDQIPADLSPPWTIEIGDSSQIVSATFGPGTPNTFAVGPLGNVILTSSQDMLDVPIVRQPGATTPAYAAITSTASDGQSSVRAGDVSLPFIQVPNPINPGWPAGPVTLQIDVYYYPPDALLGCQDASCAVVSMPGTCSAALPDPGASFVLCSSLNTVSTTTVLTVQLDCASTTGICS